MKRAGGPLADVDELIIGRVLEELEAVFCEEAERDVELCGWGVAFEAFRERYGLKG